MITSGVWKVCNCKEFSNFMSHAHWDPKFYMEVFQGEFDTDLERLGIDSWLAADPTLPLTHTVGITDWLDATKDMRVTPIQWSL